MGDIPIEMIQNIIYYLGLYVLVIIVNYFKLKRGFARNQDPSVPQEKFPYKKIFWVSNDILYAASGVYIILLDKQKDWVGPIVIVLIILIYISTNMDSMSERFNDNVKLGVHVFITLVFVIATVLTFVLKLDKSPQEKEALNGPVKVDSVKLYVVCIPYTDRTLIRNLGYDKCGDKCFAYQLKVKALNQHEAKRDALLTFWSDTLLQPLIGRDKMNKKMALIVEEDNVTIQEKTDL